VAAMVASTNSHFSQYPASLRMNARPEGEPGRSLEEIMELGDMLDERLTAYAKQNGEQLPKRIIFFRDGLSTDQFSMARGRELRRLKDAIRKRYLRAKVEQLPDIMLICTVKKHDTRFYPHPTRMIRDHNSAPGNNPTSGVAFFGGVTYGDGQDFFLVSQHAAKGTAKPTHYIVLHNEIESIQDAQQASARQLTISDIANMVSALCLILVLQSGKKQHS